MFLLLPRLLPPGYPWLPSTARLRSLKPIARFPHRQELLDVEARANVDLDWLRSPGGETTNRARPICIILCQCRGRAWEGQYHSICRSLTCRLCPRSSTTSSTVRLRLVGLLPRERSIRLHQPDHDQRRKRGGSPGCRSRHRRLDLLHQPDHGLKVYSLWTGMTSPSYPLRHAGAPQVTFRHLDLCRLPRRIGKTHLPNLS